ncbi:MAG: PD40 domain-containing protein [Holosporaceae bacterium]|nr:MAG: PD40 domain-containing protein [Holosporaceae bacterium]
MKKVVLYWDHEKDGTEEQLIADGYFVEGPSWSPDGRMLTFTNMNSQVAIKI